MRKESHKKTTPKSDIRFNGTSKKLNAGLRNFFVLPRKKFSVKRRFFCSPFLAEQQKFSQHSAFKKTRFKDLMPVFLLIATLLLITPAQAQLTFEHPGCSADSKSFCTVTTTCDLAGSCADDYASCSACEDSMISCADGSVARCENFCQSSQFGLSAGCTSCVAKCTEGSNVPTIVIPFDVLVLKQLEVTADPQERNALAGSAAQYTLHIRNRNAFQVNVQISIEVPSGWSVSQINPVRIGPNAVSSVTLSIVSPAGESEGAKTITAGIFTSDIRPPFNFVYQQLTYNVVTQQAFSVSIVPQAQQGVAGQSMDYTITVTNNDPVGIPESAFTFAAAPPAGWSARFLPSSLAIAAQSSAETTLTITAPSGAEEGSYAVSFSVSRGSDVQAYAASYEVSLCGNDICDIGEESSCAADCPSSRFTCNGRCEQQTDDGVEISSVVQGFDFIKFIACKHDSGEAQCISSYDRSACGAGNACLCSDAFSSQCSFRCVDSKGAYYMLAVDTDNEKIKSTSYSYTCPFVNLTDMVALADDFRNAADSYEQSRSVLEERIASGEDASALRPCYDGLGLIISLVSAHADYLEDVVEHPAISNTTLARQKTTEVRRNIRNYYNSYCRGTRGLLVIDSLVPPRSTVINAPVQAAVLVRSLGVPYYGYAKCIVTSPQGVNTVYQDICSQITSERNYVFTVNPDAAGEWQIMCETHGTFDTECIGASLHSQSETKYFSVYTNDVFVSAVSGVCRTNTELKCFVETSTANRCSSCRVGNIDCDFVRQEGNRAEFSCNNQFSFPGQKTIVGSVFRTDDCVPVAPVEKRTTIMCE